ncbi:hypothetical protein Q3G72_014214 [Acer saccharum]|nr:hypothetical protein Q3G72_014214 [Acer saccharum]
MESSRLSCIVNGRKSGVVLARPNLGGPGLGFQEGGGKLLTHSDENIGPPEVFRSDLHVGKLSGPWVRQWKRAARSKSGLGSLSSVGDVVGVKRSGSLVDACLFPRLKRSKSDSTTTVSDEVLSTSWPSPAHRSS